MVNPAPLVLRLVVEKAENTEAGEVFCVGITGATVGRYATDIPIC